MKYAAVEGEMVMDRKAGDPAGEFCWEHLIWYQKLVNDINCAAVLHRCLYTKRGDANTPPRLKNNYFLLSVIF